MKQTIDGKNVPYWCWYYLLDFNDMDGRETMNDMFFSKRLMNLTSDEFWSLFGVVTKKEIEFKDIIINKTQLSDRRLTLDDGEVPDRCWDYLYSFTSADEKELISNTVSQERPCDLTTEEFWKYFEVVATKEFETKGEYINNKER